MSDETKNVEYMLCQNYAPIELAMKLTKSAEGAEIISILSAESKRTLGRWLAELHYLRNVRDDIRRELADTERALERNFP